MPVPQLLVLFVLGPNVDDNGVNALSNQVLDALQSQLQQTVAVLQEIFYFKALPFSDQHIPIAELLVSFYSI